MCQNTKNHRIQKPSEFWTFQLPEFEKKNCQTFEKRKFAIIYKFKDSKDVYLRNLKVISNLK